MSQVEISPSVVNKWIGCEHYLTLQIRKRRKNLNPDRIHDGFFEDEDAFSVPSNFTEMLFKKGLLHERECLNKYKETWGEDKVLMVEGPLESPRDSWTSWIERVGNPFDDGYEVICQMPFKHNGMRGIADFLERRVYEESDADGNVKSRVCYEAVDSKLTRNSAKISHIKQLLFYSEAIASNFPNLGIPSQLHVALGKQKAVKDGTENNSEVRRLESLPFLETFDVGKFWWQWDRTRDTISELLVLSDQELEARTAPKWCSSCTHCEFLLSDCSKEWAVDALHGLSGIHESHIDAFKNSDIDSIGKLALLESEDLPEFMAHWDLDSEVHSEFNTVRASIEIEAGVTRDELLSRLMKLHDLPRDPNERLFTDLDPYVVAKLWRQAKLQSIKTYTSQCPHCHSQINENIVTCPHCSTDLLDAQGFTTQGDGSVMTHLFSQKELNELMVERSKDAGVADWQLTQNLTHLPEMNEYDVYIDFEGHPFWTVEADIIFLFGYIVKENGSWTYVSLWSHDDDGYPSKEMERLKALEFMSFLHERWSKYPDMKIYHYNHTERYLLSQLTDSDESMASIVEIFQNYLETGNLALSQQETMNSNLNALIESGVFIDLLAIARNSIQVACKGYSLKKLEQLAGFARGNSGDLDNLHSVLEVEKDDVGSLSDGGPQGNPEWFRALGITDGEEISAGAGAVYEYELYSNHFMYKDDEGNELLRDSSRLQKIEDYNRDDVEATREVHRWLLKMRSQSLEHEYKDASYLRPEENNGRMRKRIIEVQNELVEKW